jgi:hypothetical protein
MYILHLGLKTPVVDCPVGKRKFSGSKTILEVQLIHKVIVSWQHWCT